MQDEIDLVIEGEKFGFGELHFESLDSVSNRSTFSLLDEGFAQALTVFVERPLRDRFYDQSNDDMATRHRCLVESSYLSLRKK
jgi:hypothetical protein